MVAYFVTMTTCIALAYVIDRKAMGHESVLKGSKIDISIRIFYFLIIFLLIWFAGLRTAYNDTYNYIENFRTFIEIGPINWSEFSLTHYGGFELYQRLIKTYINENPISLIFVSSLITTTLYMHFIAKYSKYFFPTMFLFIIGLYTFSMAGIKQSIAISFAFCAIDAFFEKKRIKTLILILIAFSFHPSVLCMLSIPFLIKKAWDSKVFIVGIIIIIAIINLESVLDLVSELGNDYSLDTVSNLGSINPIRIVVEALPVAISFLCRKQINESNDKILILGTNMSIIGLFFISLGFFFNPMFMGRVALYFTSLSMISVPIMLEKAFRSRSNNRLFIIGYYVFMGLYFIMDLTKLGSVGLFVDRFNRKSTLSFIEIMTSK